MAAVVVCRTSPGMAIACGFGEVAQPGSAIFRADTNSIRPRSRPSAAVVAPRGLDAVSAREPGSLPAALKVGGRHDEVKIPDKPALDIEGNRRIPAGFPETRGVEVVPADRWAPVTSPVKTGAHGFVAMASGEFS